eukprot:1159266-Pelagomonas_calceolata.AAC.1
MSAEEVRGYLVLRIEEASGRTKKDEFVWDTNVEGEFQAFVKGKGGSGCDKIVGVGELSAC